MKKLISLFLSAYCLLACSKKKEPIIVSAEDLHRSIQKVADIMIHDIFSPPVASRIFTYPNIAAYEIMALNNTDYASLVGKVNDLTAIPLPPADTPVNYELSAMVAHMELSKRLIFSENDLVVFRDSLYQKWSGNNPEIFNSSKAYGLKVADHIANWMGKDNYSQTRTMQKYTVNTDDPTRWQPTPPAYMDGIEPHWSKIRPFVLDSSNQFKPAPPPSFSMEKDSDFYREVMEIYTISKEVAAKGNDSEEIAMAKFWDCNPYVSVIRGHLMFATKKISPGAHWLGITKIACKKTQADFPKALSAYTQTSMAIADAFISCWDEKYSSNLIRPETVINRYIDENWIPLLQTPPFPEYTSGHSVISGAAAITLTSVFGDNFTYDDDTEVPFGLPIRSFTSFNQAAEEAAISRMYGGIHYRAAVEVGVEQGRALGHFLVDKLKSTDNTTVANK